MPLKILTQVQVFIRIQTSLVFYSEFSVHCYYISLLGCHCFSDGCAYMLGSCIIYNRQQHATKSGIPQKFAKCALLMC